MEAHLWEFSDDELKQEVSRRGYLMVSAATTTPLSWNRTAPIPEGVDFEAEALEKLRGQIAKEMIEFKDYPFSGEFRPEIRSALLRIVRY